MRKLLLAATAIGALAIPASATTITGTYTASLSGGDATLDTVNRLASPFSLTGGALRSLFLQVDPNGSCYGACNPVTGTITVTFSNLTANGHNFGGFTETGVYSAFYGTQVDNVVWNGATVQSGFGLDQDGTVPRVFTEALNGGSFGTLDINMIDGSDWNVQTWVEAGLLAAPVPAPVLGAGLPGLVGGCLSLLGLNKLRRRRQGLAV